MTEAAWDPGHGLEQLTKQHPSPTRQSAELQRRQASGSLPLPLDLMPNRKGVLTRFWPMYTQRPLKEQSVILCTYIVQLGEEPVQSFHLTLKRL